MARFMLLLFSFFVTLIVALRYDPAETDYNLNQAQNARNPLDYTGEWENHVFHPSPTNWRFPFYTLFLDRFVNGDPVNDNANGTVFEQEVLDTQFRHGGDVAGLVDTLDYIQGMGVKVCDLPVFSWNFADLTGYIRCRHAVHKLPLEV
jgi:alpha-1,3-glucan synthase